MLDLDRLEADAQEGDSYHDERYPFVMTFEDASRLIAELRASRKVVEAAQEIGLPVDDEGFCLTCGKTHRHDPKCAYTELRAALTELSSINVRSEEAR